MNPEGAEPFFRRWSRRKRGTGQPDRPDAPDEPTGTGDAASPPETTGEEAIAPEGADAAAESPPSDADLPDPSTLDRDSDFSAYLSERVSSRLRRAAMRRLFSLPEFNVRDGLDDYDEDYTQFRSLGDTVTAEMKYREERRRRRDEEAGTEDAATSPAHTESGQTADRPDAADPADTARDEDDTAPHDTDDDEAGRHAHPRNDDDIT